MKELTQNEQKQQPKNPTRTKASFQISKTIPTDVTAPLTQQLSPAQPPTSSFPEAQGSSQNLQTKSFPSSQQTPSPMQLTTPLPPEQLSPQINPRLSQPNEQKLKSSFIQSKQRQQSSMFKSNRQNKGISRKTEIERYDELINAQIKSPKYQCHCIKIKSKEYFDMNGRADAFNESKAAAMEKILFAQEDYEISKSIQKKINEKKQKEQKQIQEKPDEFFQLDPRSAVLQAYRLNKSRQHIREALLISLSLVEGKLN